MVTQQQQVTTTQQQVTTTGWLAGRQAAPGDGQTHLSCLGGVLDGVEHGAEFGQPLTVHRSHALHVLLDTHTDAYPINIPQRCPVIVIHSITDGKSSEVSSMSHTGTDVVLLTMLNYGNKKFLVIQPYFDEILPRSCVLMAPKSLARTARMG